MPFKKNYSNSFHSSAFSSSVDTSEYNMETGRKKNKKVSNGFDNKISEFSKQFITNYFFTDIEIMVSFICRGHS